MEERAIVATSSEVVCGDSLDVLKSLDDNSVDAIVTDPPYGISFMGKSWDYSVPNVELWVECLRVLKPGGHLLAFASTRTAHRMTTNIEDAGFEIRDMIAWVYGSGFPKSLNIGKAVDKLQGNERDTVDGGQIASSLGNNHTLGGGKANQEYNYTRGNSPYEGWGTALKPALEPITVARRPISEKNMAENVLKWGTGGVNIDGCRVGTEVIGGYTVKSSMGRRTNNGGKHRDFVATAATGRFPANLIHDGSDEVTGFLPNGSARFFYSPKASRNERNKGLGEFEEKAAGKMSGGEETRPDRPTNHPMMSNYHPTVKPIKLMQYLVRLVTPKGGTVLDPFNGSGTTGIACKLEGANYIGIEIDPEICQDFRSTDRCMGITTNIDKPDN